MLPRNFCLPQIGVTPEMGAASNRKSAPGQKTGLFKEFKGPPPAEFSAHLHQTFTVHSPRPIDWLYCKRKIVRRKAGLRTRGRNRPRNRLTRLPMKKRVLSKGLNYTNYAPLSTKLSTCIGLALLSWITARNIFQNSTRDAARVPRTPPRSRADRRTKAKF